MKSKRTQFMAPFVVVLGCGGPKRQPEPAPARPPVAVQPTDATSTPDAPPLDADAAEASASPPTPTACYRGRCNPPEPPHRAYGTVTWVNRREFVVVIDDDRREILERLPLRGIFMDNKGNDVPDSEVQLHQARVGLQGVWTKGPPPVWRRIRIFDSEGR